MCKIFNHSENLYWPLIELTIIISLHWGRASLKVFLLYPVSMVCGKNLKSQSPAWTVTPLPWETHLSLWFNYIMCSEDIGKDKNHTLAIHFFSAFWRERHTDTLREGHTDTLRDTHTMRERNTQWDRDTKSQWDTHTHIQTHIKRDTQTHWERDTQTHWETHTYREDTRTQWERDTHTHW